MSAEEFVQGLNKVRAFNRLKDINLDDYEFDTILWIHQDQDLMIQQEH